MNDAPLDYRELWFKLRSRFHTEAKLEAVRAATAKDDMLVRRAQGSFDMANRAVAIMDEIHERERKGGVTVEDEEDTRH